MAEEMDRGTEAFKIAEKMDRGTESLKSHVADAKMMSIRQIKRGGCPQIVCKARDEYKVFVGESQVASALEEANSYWRFCCFPFHPFSMVVKVS